MASIFTGGSQGLLWKAPPGNGSAATALVTIDGAGGLFDSVLLMSSGIEITRVQDVEYQKTLSSNIYGYTFGEGPGKIQLSGYAFLTNSNGGSSSPGAAVGKINGFYDGNNVTAKKGDPINITVGSVSFPAHLEVMSIVLQSNAYNMGSFTMTFTTIHAQD